VWTYGVSDRVRLQRLLFNVHHDDTLSPAYGEIYLILSCFVNWNPKLAKRIFYRILYYVHVCADCFYNTIVFFLSCNQAWESTRERKKTHYHLVACWIIFHLPTFLLEQGFFCEKKEYWLLKVSMTTVIYILYIITQCNVVNEVDSSYLKSESLLISARLFVVLTARFSFIISDIAHLHDSSNDTLSLIKTIKKRIT